MEIKIVVFFTDTGIAITVSNRLQCQYQYQHIVILPASQSMDCPMMWFWS